MCTNSHAYRNIHAPFMYMLMYRQIDSIIHTCACTNNLGMSCLYFVIINILAKLSYELRLSCLINLRRVDLGQVLCGPARVDLDRVGFNSDELSVIPLNYRRALYLHRRHPVDVPIQRMANLFSAIPSNDKV